MNTLPVVLLDDVSIVPRSIIWTPSSSLLATTAYTLEPIVTVSTPYAPSSSSKPFTPSVTDAVAVGEPGVVISIIWTPSSSILATTAYTLEPIVTVSTPYAPLSSSKPPHTISYRCSCSRRTRCCDINYLDTIINTTCDNSIYVRANSYSINSSCSIKLIKATSHHQLQMQLQ